jgi:hypothetical protein
LHEVVGGSCLRDTDGEMVYLEKGWCI